ncbi:FliG C-terminal domain-containing protein [Leptospira ilyithenensis]|uniref:Endoflagellar motor switch protein n=1 Tax=Leptospira ilyithenensis TaxID=2484901 RepID=A0A4R9LSI9_9LEPT|nr:FliG C-terminal domain-containing protein [Leptospira ilyithenensis]TGN14364.1 endoflagellar motor switch protein [Leptospira ilyithenensis]
MQRNSGKNKAALAYQILGRYLPDSVFDHLRSEEIEKLLEKVSPDQKPTAKEEQNILISFNEFLKGKRTSGTSKQQPLPEIPVDRLYSPVDTQQGSNRSYPPNQSDDQQLVRFLEEILKEETSNESYLDSLKKKTREELAHLAREESPRTIARLLSFSDPEEASLVIADYPDPIREEIIFAISQIDFHSERERDELERFLRFKSDLISKKLPVSKVKNRKAKTAGEILTRLPFSQTQNLIDRIQKKSPEFAETIIEHYFRMEDLLYLGRTSLTRFFSEIHPLVIACALKGVETSFKESIFENLEAWLAKDIRVEWDSLGPVSLAEIEEAQKGVLDRLREEIEEGKLKLWRMK